MNIHELLLGEIREANGAKSSWSGKLYSQDVTFYSAPLTPADMEAVNKRYPGFEQSPTQPGFAYLLCIKAVDEDGKKVFAIGRDLPLVLKLKSEKLMDIVNSLFGQDFPSDTDLSDDAIGRTEGN